MQLWLIEVQQEFQLSQDGVQAALKTRPVSVERAQTPGCSVKSLAVVNNSDVLVSARAGDD